MPKVENNSELSVLPESEGSKVDKKDKKSKNQPEKNVDQQYQEAKTDLVELSELSVKSEKSEKPRGDTKGGNSSQGNSLQFGDIPEGESVITTISFSNNDGKTSREEIIASIEAQGGRVLAFEEGAKGVGDLAGVVVAWGSESSGKSVQIDGIDNDESSLSVQFETAPFDATDPRIQVSTTNVGKGSAQDVSHTTEATQNQYSMSVSIHDDSATATSGSGGSSGDDGLAVSAGFGSQTSGLVSNEGKKDDTLSFGLVFDVPSDFKKDTGDSGSITLPPPVEAPTPAPTPTTPVENPAPVEGGGGVEMPLLESPSQRGSIRQYLLVLIVLSGADSEDAIAELLEAYGLEVDTFGLFDPEELKKAEEYVQRSGANSMSFIDTFLKVLQSDDEIPVLW